MIFLFYSFSFSFSHAHVQTSWAFQWWLLWPINSSFWCWCHWTPFATANLDEFVQQDLIVLVNRKVLLIRQEIFRLLSLLSIPLELLRDLLRVLRSYIIFANVVHLFYVGFHLSIIVCEQWVSYCFKRKCRAGQATWWHVASERIWMFTYYCLMEWRA